MKVRMVLVVMALVMACLLLATACGASSQPEPVKTTRATTTAAPSLWLEHYPWDLKTQVDQWITNCEDIQTQFDVIYEARDGYKRRFGRNGSDILEYLHQIGKRMGCEDFQW